MDNHSFEYNYSAQQQKEVEAIRSKYLPREADKMEQLRKLHAIPTQKAQAASLAVGIIGALIMGTGMVLVALAYPLYNRVLKKQREKIAPEILRLSDELLK